MCKSCIGNVEGESCGWPKGTVRATVALITIPLAFISSLAIMILLIVEKEYTIALGINSVIWGVIGTIIGHYFGTKQAEGAAQLVAQTEHELLERGFANSRYIPIGATNNGSGITSQPLLSPSEDSVNENTNELSNIIVDDSE